MVIELLRFLKGGRAHKAILYSAGLVLVAAAILTAAGCYETDFEVIDASSAVAVSNAPGTYTFPSGATRTISVVPDSNDYRLREVTQQAISGLFPYRGISISFRSSMTTLMYTISLSLNLTRLGNSFGKCTQMYQMKNSISLHSNMV
jgi:hypothetical protein